MFLLSLPAAAQSRSTEKELEALKDKVLTLRNFSRSSAIRFDETGVPRKIEDQAPWALYAQFLVHGVDLSSNRLRLSGPRIVSHYDYNMKKMVQLRSNLQLEVTIDVKPDATTSDIATLINRVFIRPEELVSRVPSYWKEFLQGSANTTDMPATAPENDLRIRQLAGNVMQTQLVKTVRPKYPEDARQYLFEGFVTFRAEISEKGDVENLMIVSPAGAGFDESAAEAVYQWKYKSQTVNGLPVRVITAITVNYSIGR